MTDLIDWDSLKSPSKPHNRPCPNCKSTPTKVQTRKWDHKGTVKQNAHCPHCGWGWSHYVEGHESLHRGLARSWMEDLGRIYPDEMDDDERERFEAAGEAIEELAGYYGIDYPLRTFEDDG